MREETGQFLTGDPALVRRVQMADAAAVQSAAAMWAQTEPESGFALVGAGGGWAVCFGAASPLNGARGMGMMGPVAEEDVERVEGFFAERGQRTVLIELCPIADQTLIEALARRGYQAREFENVLLRPVAGGARARAEGEPEPRVGVGARDVQPEEIPRWSSLVMRGFLNGADPPPEYARIEEMMQRWPGLVAYFGTLDGEPVGGASIMPHDGVAMFGGAGVLPEARGRGVQQALLRARLAGAAALGCDLARVETRPATTSQRNAERFGFRVAYTKIQMMRDL